jgi:hypothetical protein
MLQKITLFASEVIILPRNFYVSYGTPTMVPTGETHAHKLAGTAEWVVRACIVTTANVTAKE